MISITASTSLINPSIINESFTNVVGYSHSLNSYGYYNTATVSVVDPLQNLEYWRTLVGTELKAYSDGVEVWEGFINQISVNLSGFVIEIGPYMDVYNKVRVKYDNTLTGWAEDTNSQSIYGIREAILSSATKQTAVAEATRDTYLTENSYLNVKPQSITIDVASGGENTITLNCVGYHNLLKYQYYDATSAVITVAEKVDLILDNEPNGYFDNIVRSVEANTLSVQQQESDYTSADGILRGLMAMGNHNNNYKTIWGFGNNMMFFTNEQPLSSKYYWSYKSKVITDEYGREVKPAEVQAGTWLTITDFPYSTASNIFQDVRTVFIDDLTYSYPYSLTLNTGKQSLLSQYLSKLGLGGI